MTAAVLVAAAGLSLAGYQLANSSLPAFTADALLTVLWHLLLAAALVNAGGRLLGRGGLALAVAMLAAILALAFVPATLWRAAYVASAFEPMPTNLIFWAVVGVGLLPIGIASLALAGTVGGRRAAFVLAIVVGVLVVAMVGRRLTDGVTAVAGALGILLTMLPLAGAVALGGVREDRAGA